VQLELHPKQSTVFRSKARQILFGGAAGPGKSYLLRVAAIAFAIAIPGLQIYFFRSAFPDLYRNHMEGPRGFPALLAEWISSKLVKINYSEHTIAFRNGSQGFANGSKIFLAQIARPRDLTKIQGAEIHLALIDELTHFTKAQYAYIRSRVRMTGVVIPEEFRGLFPRIITGSNPGGLGHNWVKALFIDPAPPGEIWMAPPTEGGLSTQFIPALLEDNPTLAEEDPDYADRLRGLDDPELVKAMLGGLWDLNLGGMFDDLWHAQTHILKPFAVPPSWFIDRSFDWGSSAPFSVCWWAESDGTEAPNKIVYPRGTLFLIREWYGWNGKANEGCKMLARDVARGIKEKEEKSGWKVRPGPADPSIWNENQKGQSIAIDMQKEGVTWLRADNARIQGWEQIRKRMTASLHFIEDPQPGLFVFDTCRHFIRTVPTLPRDPDTLDDADTKSEDHEADSVRYKCATKRGRFGVSEVLI